MKKSIAMYLVIVSMVTCNTQAASTISATSLDTSSSKKIIDGKNNYFTAGVGLGAGESKMRYEFARTDANFSGKQITVDVGISFKLPRNFRTTTNLAYNRINLNKDTILEEMVPLGTDIEVDSFSNTDIGLKQKLQYEIAYQDVTLMPFVELGVAKGRHYMELNSEEMAAGYRFNWDYMRSSVAIGSELKINKYIYYLKAEASSIDYAARGKVTLVTTTGEDTKYFDHSEEQQGGSQMAVTLGVSFQI